MIEVRIMSQCHLTEKEWVPEREPLSKTLKTCGGMEPRFDFATSTEVRRYDQIKAPPSYRMQAMVGWEEYPVAKNPSGTVDLKLASELLGIPSPNLAYLVRNKKIAGDIRKKTVNMGSAEMYLATR